MMEKDDVIGPFNLGNPVEFTVKELAEKVVKLTGSKSKIMYMPLPKDDPCKRKPDITRASALRWVKVMRRDRAGLGAEGAAGRGSGEGGGVHEGNQLG